MLLLRIGAKSPYPVRSAEHPASGGTSGASHSSELCTMFKPSPMRTPDSWAWPPASRAWPWIQESQQGVVVLAPDAADAAVRVHAGGHEVALADRGDAVVGGCVGGAGVDLAVRDRERRVSSLVVDETDPLILDFVIWTPLARIVRPQLIVLRSMTVPLVVMVHGPV